MKRSAPWSAVLLSFLAVYLDLGSASAQSVTGSNAMTRSIRVHGHRSSLIALSDAGGTQAPALLAAPFQDHAIVQRDKPIAVWGEAASGELVSVSIAGVSASVQADASGHWQATLPAMSSGGPFVLQAETRSGMKRVLSDVFVGDIFLCSGQSNMELQVERAGDSFGEIANSTNNTIRMLTVARDKSAIPRTAFRNPVAWQSASPETVPKWSAVCFYFARELQKSIHVPIGLVHASWGGSDIRPWMSATELKVLGGYDSPLDTLALYATDEAAAQRRFAQEWEAWWRNKSGDRAGTEPWSVGRTRHGSSRKRDSASSPTGMPDPKTGIVSEWLPAPSGLGDWSRWGVPELASFTGLIWYRTHISLSGAQAKSTARLELGPINQVDETWINGQPLGNTFGYGTERSYAIPPGVLHAGDNLLVVSVLSTYGGGGLLAGGTPRALRSASGDSIPVQGPWQYRISPAAYGSPPRASWESVHGITTLYNAMIAPLGSYTMRGVLWYQGETNASEAQNYQALLTGLMADWRRQFRADDLAFLVVQLPNWGHPQTAPGEKSDWAALRDAQRAAVANDQHAGLAVTIDIGEPGNLHPTNKQDVGKRLARLARHLIYGEPITPSGPVASSAIRSAHEIAIDFGDVDGALIAYSNDHPIGFELCGDTPQSCRFAEATITGTRVILPLPPEGAGPSPTRVRYCWADSPVCTLFDRSGLPAGPFQLPVAAGDASH